MGINTTKATEEVLLGCIPDCEEEGPILEVYYA
jgi:hypothetical protein